MERPIIGLAALAASQFGSPEVGREGEAFNAADLPRSMVGIPITIVAAGATEPIQVDVQRDMRPDRLVLGPLGSAEGQGVTSIHHKVRDIRVGEVSLNASKNPVPALCFLETVVGNSIRATMTADTAVGIQLIVTNDDPTGEPPAPWTVMGGFFGPSARPGSGAAGRVGAIVGAAEDPGAPETESAQDAKNLPQSFVGIPYTQCNVGERTYIQCKIERDLRPDRMILPYDVARGYVINDIRVGTISLNASINPVVGTAFAGTTFGTRLRATVTATPNNGISLEVTRRDTASTGLYFCGGIFGPSRFAS